MYKYEQYITFKKVDRRGNYPSCSRFPKICPSKTIYSYRAKLSKELIKAL